MPIPADQLEIITITLIVWFSLVILSIYHLRNIPVASKHSEIPKLMVLALSVAGAFTLGVTVFVYAYFPQFLQSASTASIVVAGFIGAGISIWWTSATFWRELTALAQPISPKPDLNQSQLIVAEVPDIWNLMILYALNEKEQLKLSEIAQQAGMTTLTTQRRVNDMVDKGLTVKFSRVTGTYYSITPLGKMLLVKYGSDISKAIRESKKYLEDENAIQKMDESKCSNETVKHEWHILDSLVRLMTKLDALKLENGLPDLEELSFAQKLSSRTAHQIHEYYLSDEWKRLPKSLQDELRQLSVILLTFGDLKDHSRLLLSAKRAYKSTNETIALLRQ